MRLGYEGHVNAALNLLWPQRLNPRSNPLIRFARAVHWVALALAMLLAFALISSGVMAGGEGIAAIYVLTIATAGRIGRYIIARE